MRAVDAASNAPKAKIYLVVYSELKVNIVVWPGAKVIKVVRPEADILSRGGIGSFACPLMIDLIL
jgi:hypothetical protein